MKYSRKKKGRWKKGRWISTPNALTWNEGKGPLNWSVYRGDQYGFYIYILGWRFYFIRKKKRSRK